MIFSAAERRMPRLWRPAAVLAAVLAGSQAAAAPPTCRGIRFDLDTPLRAGTPYVNVPFEGSIGVWLVDYGSGASIISSTPAKPDGIVESSGLLFPGALFESRIYPVMPSIGRQHVGTIGMDILSRLTAEFHLEDAEHPFAVFTPDACRPSIAAGFFRIKGPDGSGASNAMNYPMASIALEGPANGAAPAAKMRTDPVWALIDTGYSDTAERHSIDINASYLQRLKKSIASLTVVDHIDITGCGGERTTRAVYAAPGWRLYFLNERGERLPRPVIDDFRLILKPSRSDCGGIGLQGEPAAQLGSSFLRDFGTTILRPSSSEVWIKAP